MVVKFDTSANSVKNKKENKIREESASSGLVEC